MQLASGFFLTRGDPCYVGEHHIGLQRGEGTSGYEQGVVQNIRYGPAPLYVMYELLTTTYAGCFL